MRRIAIAITLVVLLSIAASAFLSQRSEGTGENSPDIPSLEDRVGALEEHVQIDGIMAAYRGSGSWIDRLETTFDSLVVPMVSSTPVSSTIAFHYQGGALGNLVPLSASFRLYDDGQRLSAVLAIPTWLQLGAGQGFDLQITSEGIPIAMLHMELPAELSYLNMLRYRATLR